MFYGNSSYLLHLFLITRPGTRESSKLQFVPNYPLNCHKDGMCVLSGPFYNHEDNAAGWIDGTVTSKIIACRLSNKYECFHFAAANSTLCCIYVLLIFIGGQDLEKHYLPLCSDFPFRSWCSLYCIALGLIHRWVANKLPSRSSMVRIISERYRVIHLSCYYHGGTVKK